MVGSQVRGVFGSVCARRLVCDGLGAGEGMGVEAGATARDRAAPVLVSPAVNGAVLTLASFDGAPCRSARLFRTSRHAGDGNGAGWERGCVRRVPALGDSPGARIGFLEPVSDKVDTAPEKERPEHQGVVITTWSDNIEAVARAVTAKSLGHDGISEEKLAADVDMW